VFSDQPQEKVTWWLDSGDRGGQVIGNTRSGAAVWDFTNPSDPATGKFEWSTTFRVNAPVDERGWNISAGPPPGNIVNPPLSSLASGQSIAEKAPLLIQFIPAAWFVRLTKPLGKAMMDSAQVALQNKLAKSFQHVKVEILGTDGSKMKIEYEAPPKDGPTSGTFAALGWGAGTGPKETIDNALRSLVSEHTLPSDEQWSIVEDSTASFLSVPVLSPFASGASGATAGAPLPIMAAPSNGQTGFASNGQANLNNFNAQGSGFTNDQFSPNFGVQSFGQPNGATPGFNQGFSNTAILSN
jgi:hypothetical protein